jgi:hypothetical protein
LFNVCSCPPAMCDCLHRNAVLSYCLCKIGSSDQEAAMKYGLRKGFFDIDGQLTSAGNTRAQFFGVFGEAGLAELRDMLAEEESMAAAKVA